MLHSRQLFNNIRRYTHTHSPSFNKTPKLDTVVLESKLDKLSSQLNDIDTILKFNYVLTFVLGISALLK